MTDQEDRAMILTAEDGFAAMFEFLRSYWEELKTADLTDVLSEMNPAQHGQSSDPAAWEEWVKAVRKVTTKD
jgi:hypothetical protein